MEVFDTMVTLAIPSTQNAPQTRMPHWVVRLLITWFGFGLLTAATVAGLQALSVDISPMERRLIAYFNRTFRAIPG